MLKPNSSSSINHIQLLHKPIIFLLCKISKIAETMFYDVILLVF